MSIESCLKFKKFLCFFFYFYISLFAEAIDKSLLKSRSGEFDIESIHSVSLKHLGKSEDFVLSA